MRAHPYFSYFIIPLLKKKKKLKPKAVREQTGEHPGRNKHAFLKSLDFLHDVEGNIGGRRDSQGDTRYRLSGWGRKIKVR